jgi:hypothetical protein
MFDLEALVSHPSLGAHADTYGRLIGGWRAELQSHLPGHSAPPASLEIHFGWALEGRAVQDVWITPARDQRAVGVTASLRPLARSHPRAGREDLALGGRDPRPSRAPAQ